MAEQTEKTKTGTHWKVHLDSNFINGDDLKAGLRGIKDNMVVTIASFSDRKSYDVSKQAESVVTGLFLNNEAGQALHKPLALNKTTAKFLEKETGFGEMEQWIGYRAILYAVPSSRFGFLARLKKYEKIPLELGSENFNKCRKSYLADPKVLPAIQAKYSVGPEVELALCKPEPKAAK